MTILLLESLHADAHCLLADYGPVHLVEDWADLAAFVATHRVDAILTRGRGRITADLIDACPDLSVVARCGVGLDNIDVAAAARRAIPVIYAPGSTTNAVAEHTILLMLALARRLRPLVNAVAVGNWGVRDGYSGMELAGKTLGIVGMGSIGRRVAELASTLGMTVHYWSLRSRDERFSFRPLDLLLRDADIITLHLSLTSQTRHLIGPTQLALMKPSALLINTARGVIIDQQALCEALDAGKLGGFAADVLAVEPPDPTDPLLHSDKTLITPHTAVLTDATYRTICVRTAGNVLAVLRGDAPEAASLFAG
jgi:D-3-phosphoglycerate dehydrogenase / 2-oxoglutarate reductase